MSKQETAVVATAEKEVPTFNGLRVARVFPRLTSATPDDALAFAPKSRNVKVAKLPMPPTDLQDIDEVHISTAFTYDAERVERLYEAWRHVGVPVYVGGPARKEPGGEFIPGMYIKQGYVITSRGCPNRCIVDGVKFCSVPEREGFKLRELTVKDGFNLIDDNLLACSEQHIRSVFDMLKRQKERPQFTGGLESRLLKQWHVDLLRDVKTARMYFAYDIPQDLEPLVEAGKLLQSNGFKRSSCIAACYVLCGFPGDTMDAADKRCREAWAAGFKPFAMVYRDEKGEVAADWAKFQTLWLRPQIAHALLKDDERKYFADFAGAYVSVPKKGSSCDTASEPRGKEYRSGSNCRVLPSEGGCGSMGKMISGSSALSANGVLGQGSTAYTSNRGDVRVTESGDDYNRLDTDVERIVAQKTLTAAERKRREIEAQGSIVKDFKVGNTRIKINDAYCRDKSQEDVQNILSGIASRAQEHLNAQATVAQRNKK